jgi:formamidopyrimidine-DNA glycosylase
VPELPEVEHAAGILRVVALGRAIVRLRLLHPSFRRQLTRRAVEQLRGETIAGIDRRGKYQLLRLWSGRTLVVHFRMTGDWAVCETGSPLPRHARAALELDNGTSLVLVDSRALGALTLVDAGLDPTPSLGPEATSTAFNARRLAASLARRHGPIKPVLLDQSIVAGIGNIYASEALWYARVDPRARASSLGPRAIQTLVRGAKRALRRALAHPKRYYASASAQRFNVYDREGAPCRRCGGQGVIRRVVQAGRSTYFCPGCQGTGERVSR